MLVAHTSLEMDASREHPPGHALDPPPQAAVPDDDQPEVNGIARERGARGHQLRQTFPRVVATHEKYVRSAVVEPLERFQPRTKAIEIHPVRKNVDRAGKMAQHARARRF